MTFNLTERKKERCTARKSCFYSVAFLSLIISQIK